LSGTYNLIKDLASFFVISYLHSIDAQIIAILAFHALRCLNRRVAHIYRIRKYYKRAFAL
jgi:hypothetical protein